MQNLSYTYDAVGNVLSIVDAKAGGTQTQSFSYDHLDRLKTAQASGGTGGTYAQETYTYSAIGNLLSKAGVNYTYNATVSGCSAGTPSPKPHAVSQVGSYTFTYDCNGNMLTRTESGGTYNQTWDTENRLSGISGAATATFAYDGDGNRVKATVNGVTTVYVGNYFEQSGTTIKKYYYAGSQRVAMWDGSTVYFLLGDHLGSTAITANASGGLHAELRYKPWGETRYASGTTPTTFRFTGQREEASLGSLYFYQARFYSPVIGRFVSADTIVPEPGNPQSLNRYSYVLNNPVKYTDPTGHRVCDEDTLDCSTRRWHRFGASANLTAGQMRAIYGIRLTADEGHPWTASDISNISEAVQQAAAALDFATWANGRPTNTNVARFFKSVLYSNLTFHRSAQISAGAASTDNGTITVYARNATTDWRLSPHNAVHELGHAISQSAGRQPYNDLNAAQITDNVGNVIAGGGGPGPYVRTDDGYATAGFPWQQHRQVMGDPEDPPTANEDFADMFLGWAYGNFANDLNGAGAARNTWMSANMPGWIALAVNGN